MLGLLSGVFGRSFDVRDVVVKSFDWGVDVEDKDGDYPVDVSRIELSLHRLSDGRIRREFRFSGELPLRTLIEEGFVSDHFDVRNISIVNQGLALLKELARSISGASSVDNMSFVLRDIAVALDEGKIHNLMLHIGIPPKSIPEDYERKNNMYVKKIVVPWSKPLLPQVIELWVSKKSTTIYVKASSSPIGYEDLVKIIGLIQYELRRIYGRHIDEDNIRVLRVEYNIDKPVSIVLQDMVITIKDIDGEYRVYTKKLPTGDVVKREEFVSRNERPLSSLLEEFRTKVNMAKTLSEIKKDLELIKGSLPRQAIEATQLSEAVATKLANLIYLTFEKWGNRFELALRELASRLQEALKPVFERIERLEKENQELRRRLHELTQQDSSIKFEDLPRDLKEFLRELERDGYVRLTETRVSYGDRVWQAIFKRKGNIDGWIENESYNYYEEKELFKAVLKAIRFHDNKYRGKPGVPYDKFLEALGKFLGSEVTGVTSGYTHSRQHTLNGYIRSQGAK